MAGMTQSWAAGLTDVDTTARCPIGTIRRDSNREYKYVKFSGTTSIAAGDFLCYVTSAGASDTATIVDGANAGSLVGAGVALATVGTGTVMYGFIQVRGLATLSTALAGSPGIGDELTQAGATAPAVTKKATDNGQAVAVAFDVTNKLVMLTCPN